MGDRTDCLDEETILGFTEGLAPDRLAAVELHARACGPCQERLSAAFAARGSGARAGGFGPLAGGTAVGRYTVRRLVGQGGMGEVYAAHDTKLDRTIALKLLRSRAAGGTPRGESRLIREAQAIARLSHPNVITVHDVGAHGDRVFLAMEYIEGQTLSAWLAERPRARAQVIGAFREAARGLAAAHAAGVVHRDFKPQNVMVGSDGAVRVTDFGLARRLDAGDADRTRPATDDAAAPLADVTLTKTGELIGTPLYMSPEQLRGEPTDARSDQFSFCVALYQALYAEHPFLDLRRRGGDRAGGDAGRDDDGVGDDKLAELLAALRAGMVRPTPARSGVPSWLRQLVLRGLAMAPADRWPSMDHLIAALERDPARRRYRLALVTAAAALGTIAVVLGLVRPLRTAEARRAPAAAPAPARATVTAAITSEPGGGYQPAPGVAPLDREPALTIAPPRSRAHARASAHRAASKAAPPPPPEPAEQLLLRAEERVGLGRIGEGCALGQLAAERTPRSPAVWEFLGRCYMRMAEPQEALTCYRKYLDLAPDGPNAPFIRAIVERGAP